MDCAFLKRAIRIVATTLLLAAAAADVLFAQQRGAGGERGDGGGRRGPVYQRHAYGGSRSERGHGRGDYHPNNLVYFPTQQTNAGWFQRPYPYHLDYYRMRYGGSYAPYFGNLYGPPQVVTAPPYYGPYYGAIGGYGVGYPSGMMLPPPEGEGASGVGE